MRQYTENDCAGLRFATRFVPIVDAVSSPLSVLRYIHQARVAYIVAPSVFFVGRGCLCCSSQWLPG